MTDTITPIPAATLRECPFCGASATLRKDGDSYFATCSNRLCIVYSTTYHQLSPSTAIARWNTRPVAYDSAQREIAALRERVAELTRTGAVFLREATADPFHSERYAIAMDDFNDAMKRTAELDARDAQGSESV